MKTENRITLDADGALTAESFGIIALCDIDTWEECRALLEAVQQAWWTPIGAGYGYGTFTSTTETRVYHFFTLHNERNETLIKALQANKDFWARCWYMSKRTGHHVFHVPNESTFQNPEPDTP